MDKKRAILMLARDLAEHGYVSLVEDETVKNYISKNSIMAVPVRTDGKINSIGESCVIRYYSGGRYVGIRKDLIDPDDKKSLDFSGDMRFSSSRDGIEKAVYYSKKICEEGIIKKAKKIGSNCVFLTKKEFVYMSREVETSAYIVEGAPMAVVEKDDEETFKEIYKGHPPEEIEGACRDLGLDVSVDYLYLYENSPETFKEYFSAINDKDKEEEVNKIVLSDLSNPELEEWLSENFSEISKKVAIQKVRKI